MNREEIRKKWKNRELAEISQKKLARQEDTQATKPVSQGSSWERVQNTANQIMNIRNNPIINVENPLLNRGKTQDNKQLNKKQYIADDARALVKGIGLGGYKGGVTALGQTEFLSQQRSDTYRKYNQRATRIKEQQEAKTADEQLQLGLKQLGNAKASNGILMQKQPSINESASMQYFNKKEEELNKKIAQNAETASTNAGKYLAGQVAPSMGQSLVGTGLDIIAPGMGAGYRMLSYSGNYTQDGLNKGMNENQASMYGLTMAGVETAMDTIGDKLKGVAIGESKGANGLKNFIKTSAKELGINSFFEGSGEALTEPLQELVAKAYGGKADYEGIAKRMGEAFLAGAVSELLMTGASLGYGGSINVLNKTENGQQVSVEEVKSALKEIDNKNEVDIKNILQNNLNFAEENLTQENQQAINQARNEKLENIATELDRTEGNRLVGFNNYKKQEQIENSGLTDIQKQKLTEISQKYDLSQKDIQDLIDNTKNGKYEENQATITPNNEILNQEQQTIQEEGKQAQNQLSQETEENKQKVIENQENIKENKEKQLKIIQESNPMQDDYHTGIRNVEDIKTFAEAIEDDESFVWGDYSKEDAQRDLEKGTVTVYSSKPIEDGVFVSTSKNQAQDYAGNEQIYSQEIPINDVAWINGDEGQYAKVDTEQKALNLRQSIDNYNNSRAEGQEIFDINNEETRKEIESIQKIAQDRNINIIFDENRFKNSNENAFYEYDKDNNVANIVLNPNSTSKKYVQNLVIHEMTHSFEGSKQYDSLSKAVLDFAKSKGEYDSAFKDLMNTYSKVYSGENLNEIVEKEAVANILGEKLGDKEFVDSLVNNQYVERSTIQKIIDFIKNQINRFKGYKDQEAYWNHVKTLFEDAYNKSEVSQEGLKNGELRYSIGGEKSLTANIDKLNKAKELKEEGLSTIDIYKQTGWYESIDGKWKYEIDDSNFNLKENLIEKDTTYDLEEILDAPELFKAYPKLKEVSVSFDDLGDSTKGEKYSRMGFDYITLNNDLINESASKKDYDLLGIKNQSKVYSTLMHEIQHVIQGYEDFAKGSNIDFWSNTIKDIDRKYERTQNDYQRFKDEIGLKEYEDKLLQDWKKDKITGKELTQRIDNYIEEKGYTEKFDRLAELQKELLTQKYKLEDATPGTLYFFTAGELEAREVQNRINKDSEWRKQNLPQENGMAVFVEDFTDKITDSYSSKTTTKDSQGRELSKGQQEYFKDSKVRDENGNLIELNHATPDNTFTVFEQQKVGKNSSDFSQGGELGRGFYFSDESTSYTTWNYWVEEQTGKPAKSMKVYLDLKNPFNYNGTELNQEVFDYLKNQNLSDVEKIKNNRDIFNYCKKNNIDIQNMLKDLGYDGIIEKGYGDSIFQAVAFESNQIKNIDNTNPTNNPDIRYSQETQDAWNNFIEKYFKNEGTGTAIKDMKKLPEMSITKYQEVLDNAKYIPQEDKQNLLSYLEDIKKNKSSLDDFKKIVNDLNNTYKQDNVLDTTETYSTGRKEKYQKYLKSKTDYDNSALKNALDIIPANKQGRRTKEQWLNVAKQIGTEIADKSNQEIEEIAFRTWQDERPSSKESMNRQGNKFVPFNSDEWINAIYDSVNEQRQYSVDTEQQAEQPVEQTVKEEKPVDKDLQAIRDAHEKSLGDTMTVDEQIEAIQELDSEELSKKLPDTSSKIVNKRSKQKTTFKDKVTQIRKLITNKGVAVDNLFKATGNKEGIWKYDRYLGSYNEGNVSVGVRQINSKGEVVGDALLDIYKNSKKAGIPENVLDDYVYNKDAIARYKYEKYLFGKEISSEDSQRIVDEYDKKYPQIKEYGKQLSDFANNSTKGYLVGTFIDNELYNNLREMYPDHIPVIRDISETPGLTEYDNVGAQVLKRAKGGSQDILSAKEALSAQAISYARAFRKNEALREVYKSLKADTKVLYDLGKIIDIEQANDCIKNAVGYDESLNKYTATIFENGKAKVFEINKDIFDAFNNDTIFNKIDKALGNSLVGKTLSTSSKVFKELTTGKNILYAGKNMARDINDAPINSTANFGTYMKDWTRAYNQIITNGKYYQEFVNAGGEANTFYDYNKGVLSDMNPKLPKKVLNTINKNTIGRIEDINKVVETAPRLAEYIATRERGGSIDEALYNSAEVTTNFKRGGELTKLVDKYGVPYLNASIQGLSKVYRNISEAKGFKQYAKLAISATLAGVLPSLFNHLVYDDDEDYEQLPDYLKDGYYLIKVNNLPFTENNFIRIPKGRISAVLGGTAVRVHDSIKQKDIDVWDNYLSDVVLNNIGVNNPLTNNLFSGLIQAKSNEAWYGGSIYSDTKYNNKLPLEIYDDKTTELSKWIAETLYNMVGEKKYKQLVDKDNGNAFFKVLATPKLLDYVINQYSGIVGDLIMPMLTPYAETNLFVDEFTTSSTLKSNYVSKFYDILGNCYANSEYATDTDKLTYKYLSKVSKEVGDLYKQKSDIQKDSSLTNKQKQQKTYEIQKQINNKMKETIDKVEKLELTDTTASFDGTNYYKDAEGNWQSIKDEDNITGLNPTTYANYQNRISEATAQKREETGKDKDKLNDSERIEVLKEGNYSKKEKDLIYRNIINDDDEVYDSLKLLDNNSLACVDAYFDYKTSDFSNDRKDDGTAKGKSITKSGQKKLQNFLNNSNLTYMQKLYLTGVNNSSLNSTERQKLKNYIYSLNITEQQRKTMENKLKFTTEMKDGSYKWK